MKTNLITSVLFAAMISAIIFSETYAQASYSAQTTLTGDSGTYLAAYGDINGDGKQDIAVTNYYNSNISVFLNTTTPGASSPSFTTKTDFTTGVSPRCLQVIDINADGKPDLINSNDGNSISILINTTTPGSLTPLFSSKTDFATGSFPVWICITDLNGDGKSDLLIPNYSGSSFSAFINSTSPGAAAPTFEARTDFSTFATPACIASGDLNGDGKQDIAMIFYRTTNNISVYLNTTSPGASSPTFSSASNFTTENAPSFISIGDVNNDGKPDLVNTDADSNDVSVLINTTTTGSAVPSFTARTDFAIGVYPSTVVFADLNLDGRLDLLSSNSVSNSVSILLNITSPGSITPSFYTREDFPAGNNTYNANATDLNGDNKPDILAANFDNNSVSVFLNVMGLGNAPASFSAATDFVTNSEPYWISLGDLNGDGKKDMVSSNFASTNFSVFLNTTAPGSITPTFSAKTDFTTTNSPESAAITEINGDGRPDIVVANYPVNSISIFLNTTSPGASTPSFSAATDFTSGSGPTVFSFGDLNLDGKQDIAVGNYTSSTVSVYLNTTVMGSSTPTLSSKIDLPTGAGSGGVSVGELNGDGKPDLAISNFNSSTVSIYLNTTSPGASTPTFSTKTDLSIANVTTVLLEDVNYDNVKDLIATKNNSATVLVLINTTSPGGSTPSFSSGAEFSTGANPYIAAVSDLNGDGRPDIAVINNSVNMYSILLNNTSPGSTTPVFAAKTDFPTGSDPYTVTAGDINNDGKPDLVTANHGANTASVFLNDINLPLPVELSSFTASVELQNVVLKWTTMQELNNSGFEVERKLTGVSGSSWSRIGFIQGSGTTNQIKKYSFRDINLSSGHYSYRLKQIDYNGNFKYYELSNEVVVGIPSKFSLSQNYPNPFNPVTKIDYSLPVSGLVSLKIYDISGREVSQLVSEIQQEGYYSLNFNASGLSSGTYFYQIKAGGFVETKKMMVVK